MGGGDRAETALRNQMERQLSNASDNPDRQDQMIARWLQQNKISEADAEYLYAKIMNTRGLTTNGR